MKPYKRNKLVLDRETVAVLQADLDNVVGGCRDCSTGRTQIPIGCGNSRIRTQQVVGCDGGGNTRQLVGCWSGQGQ